jgi:hypothetical protein
MPTSIPGFNPYRNMNSTKYLALKYGGRGPEYDNFRVLGAFYGEWFH